MLTCLRWSTVGHVHQTHAAVSVNLIAKHHQAPDSSMLCMHEFVHVEVFPRCFQVTAEMISLALQAWCTLALLDDYF